MHKYELRAWLSGLMANICLFGDQKIASYIWAGLAIVWLSAYVFREEVDK